ncbi:MAG: glutathione synthase [Burkholderiaceae bacterium]
MSQGLSVLFVVDPLDRLKAYKDSSVAMMRELARRGHDVWATTQPELRWWSDERGGRVQARAHLLELVPVAADEHAAWYVEREAGQRELASFDVVLMRKDPPFDTEYLYSTFVLEAAQRSGTRVFNDPRALRDHNEKFAITEFADYAAPTLVSRSPDAIRQFQRDHGDIVVKPLDGMGGTSVFRLRPDDPNTNVILETITREGSRTVMAQRFIPEIRDGDKRVLLIGGEPVPFALARVPRPGESRGNLAAGGIGRAQPLSESDRAIAAALGPVLAARGLLLVGLDVIGDYLTEINVTSPTCFVEITQQTGFDVAAMFADALERAVAR